MSTQMSDDFDAFKQFVSDHLSARTDELSLEQGLAAFRAYQSELTRLRIEIQPALDELNQDGGSDLDIEEIIEKGKEQLRLEGIN